MKPVYLLLSIFLFPFIQVCDAQWNQLTVPNSTASYKAVYFKDANNGFIAGAERIRKTTNGGTTWDTVSYGALWANLTLSIVENIQFVNTLEGIASGYSYSDNAELVFKTYDGGNTWSSIKHLGAFGTYLSDMHFPSSTVGYCVGDLGHIIKSTDAGETWNPLTSGTSVNLKGVYFSSTTTGYVVGDQIILKTINGGTSWTSQTFTGVYFNDVHFISATIGFAIGNGIYKTTDAGVTWNQVSSLTGLNDITSVNTDTIFLAADAGVYKSNDIGSTFFLQASIVPNVNFKTVYFYNSTLGFATTSSGKVFKTTVNGNSVQQNDAGVILINGLPSGSCQGGYPIDVKIKNYGQSNLTSATIRFKVNGVLQPSFIWNGNLPHDSTSGLINIGSYNFSTGSFSVQAFTTQANGQSDVINYNDTVSTTITFTRLNGTFTVGGSTPNYIDVTAAITALNSFGICGNVNFKIRNGTYYANTTIQNFFRTNATDTVTFYSETGDSSQVIISGGGSPTLSINQASLLIFSGVTFKSTNNNVLMLYDSTNNITFSNCVIDIASSKSGLIHDGSGCENLVINKVRFVNGAKAIEITNAFSTQMCNQVSITDCIFDQQNSEAVYVKANGATISNNIVNAILGNGIKVDGCNNGFLISNNKVTVAGSGNALHIFNCKDSSGAEGVVVNNYLALGLNAINDKPVVHIRNSSHINLHYNTIVAHKGYAINLNYQTDTTTIPNIDLNNNILCNRKNVTIFHVDGSFGADPSTLAAKLFKNIGFNGYYNPPGDDYLNFNYGYVFGYMGNGAVSNSFEEWKLYFPSDSTSIFADPELFSLNDYHIYPDKSNCLFNNHAKVIAGITTDIDGDARSSINPDIGCDEFQLISTDAGIKRIIQEQQVCAGLNPIEVKVINYGETSLQNVTVNWSVNGIVQTPVIFNGNLNTADSSGLLTLGVYNFIAGNTYVINAWTTNPNGLTDINNINDSSIATLIAKGLSGTYTIGGITPDYTNPASAISDLSLNGVCGPVIFNVRSGLYLDTLTISAIAGASETNTITFQSENGDSSSVVFYFFNGKIMTLNAAGFITFKQLTFIDSISSSGFHACIYFTNKCHHVKILNCSFINTGTEGLIVSDGKTLSDIEIKNSNFEFGNFGVWFDNLSFHHNRNISIINNNFSNQLSVGVIVGMGKNVLIDGNSFHSYLSFASSELNGIKVSSTGGPFTISNNKLDYRNYRHGIYVNSPGFSNKKNIVANNMVNMFGANVRYCYNFQYASNLRVVHNSGLIDSSSYPDNTTLYSPGQGSELLNNCLVNKGSGPAITFNLANGYYDHNNYYSLSVLPVLFSTNYDLPGWQSISGADLHSLSTDPNYNALNDLHISSNSSMMNAGIAIPDIKFDIDHHARHPSNPDIGADEFSLSDSLVWPGDCNYDGVANNYDLLSIGLYFNHTGISRSTITNAWAGQASSNWNTLQYCGYDKKHADCNGDSIINWSDTTAIKQNWGQPAHPLKLNLNPIPYITSQADLFFVSSQTSCNAGDTIDLELWAGNAGNPVMKLYGISLDVGFTPGIVKPGSMSLAFPPNWLGIENVTTVTTANISSTAAASIVRVTGSDTAGYGMLAKLHFIIDSSFTINSTLNLSFTNYLAVTADGTIVQFNTISDSLLINPSANVSENSWNPIIGLYPNPTTGELNLKYSIQQSANVRLEFYNSLGKRLSVYKNEKISQGEYEQHLNFKSENFSEGIYLLKLMIDEKSYSIKVMIK